MHVAWKSIKSGNTGKVTDCWDWHRDGKKLWTLWSKRYDGSRPKKNEYYDGEMKTLKKGNLVAKQYAKLTK